MNPYTYLAVLRAQVLVRAVREGRAGINGNRFCLDCEQDIDEKTCDCGAAIRDCWHDYTSNHIPRAMGCLCGHVDREPMTIERVTKGLYE